MSRGPQYLENPETGCWEWQRWKVKGGYGLTTQATGKRGGKKVYAHRKYYEQHVGAIPEGMHLDHLCSNPSCVNPAHLEPVTPAENTRRSRTAKITAAQVVEIREQAATGRPRKEIAADFGLSLSGLEKVIYGECWKGVAA